MVARSSTAFRPRQGEGVEQAQQRKARRAHGKGERQVAAGAAGNHAVAMKATEITDAGLRPQNAPCGESLGDGLPGDDDQHVLQSAGSNPERAKESVVTLLRLSRRCP